MSVGIYKIVNPVGQIYIGQSWDIERRFKKNYRFAHLCKNQSKLCASLKEFGINKHVFTIIQELPNDVAKTTLDEYELLYMQQFKATGHDMLNLRMAGGRGRHSQETINKMKGVVGKWMIGKKDTEETRKNKSAAAKGKKKPPRTKIHSLRISASNKGKRDSAMKPVSQYSLDGTWIKDWECIKDVNRELKVNSSNIVSVCKADRNHAGGFIWKYKTTA